jgi:2-oxoisovalerate dehydrogenase E2 component (dihydrolipoyl transacylase)
MSEHVFRMPDVGEGITEAELVEWFVAVGDVVDLDQPLGEVMTDKATVELYSPVAGTIVHLGAEPGNQVPVGADLVRFDASNGSGPRSAAAPVPVVATPSPVSTGRRPLASPAVRRRALEAGVDLRSVVGTGPGGRIEHADLTGVTEAPVRTDGDDVTEVPLTGLRRRIAEQLSLAASRIPHFTYVEEIDVTRLEELRRTLNERHPDRPRLTILPFVVRALRASVAAHPSFNGTFDDERAVLRRHRCLHVGMATQTARGLVVPVVRDAVTRDLWDCAAEIRRLADGARAGSLAPHELQGSTITITSLGALGGIVTTPIVNHPEVAIVGVNKIQVLPRWDGHGFAPRSVLNLSCSFDHRIVDGWDAALFVQAMKDQLEEPTLLFVEVS